MSARLEHSPRVQTRTTALAALIASVAVFGAVCGLPAATAQPPTSLSPSKNSSELKKVDHENPVPADAQGRQPHEKFVLNKDRAIFNRIEDFKPVAAQSDNPDEYLAWCEFVTHARTFSAAELDRYAARDLTPVDLLKPQRSLFRCELLRFDGRLMCVRRLDAPLFFRDNPDFGVKELYEARLVPIDESPLTPVSIVFTDLPDALAAVRQKAPKEWLDLDGAETWGTASGYYFKTMSVPGEQANSVVGVPVLVGKSVTVTAGPPAPSGDNPIALDPNVRVYKFIRDDAPMIRTAPQGEQWAEVEAYNRILIHASRFPAQTLEDHARDDLKFADLFLGVRKDYKLACVKLEGRLISLRRMESNNELRAAGVNQVFEGWLVPANTPGGHPVCVVFTEPLAGVEPNGRVNKWVSFAGYSFKLMRYESAEKDATDETKHVWKNAPLLIGNSPIPRPDPDRPTPVTWTAFTQSVIAGGVALAAAGGALAWYFRRGDRKSKEAVDAVRLRNPFDAANSN
ncbi:hypothetical protein [Frigoriglobus tundricola]|uniref:Transmembrane protein n=1 Tax=Frigoriglobus tundricola TaxID=2774151 RepID=A0A6M5YQA6_9BACT|nr:hypothetical protein [Frigoriglobus tundricola]QJW96227.1 hypothetical protein FTUN_3784 [Frigoriglobus tundricola]